MGTPRGAARTAAPPPTSMKEDSWLDAELQKAETHLKPNPRSLSEPTTYSADEAVDDVAVTPAIEAAGDRRSSTEVEDDYDDIEKDEYEDEFEDDDFESDDEEDEEETPTPVAVA